MYYDRDKMGIYANPGDFTPSRSKNKNNKPLVRCGGLIGMDKKRIRPPQADNP
jgi:hypothetical protein